MDQTIFQPQQESRESGIAHVFLYFLAIVTHLLALLMASNPAGAAPLDQGGAKFDLSYYSLRFNTGGQAFSLSEAYSNLELFQRLTNYGVLEGRIAYSHLQEPSGWNQAYGRLTFKDFRWGRGVLAFSAGDQAFALSKFPLTFSNFFYPMVYFRGFSTELAHPYFQIQVLGGGVTYSRGLLGETFLGIGEGVYGLLLRSQPAARWSMESAIFATNNEKDFNGNLVTKNNIVYRLASQYRVWSELFLAGEFMQSFSETPASKKQQDVAYRAGTLWKGERLRLEANYRDMGPRFHLINQIYQPDQGVKGYFVSTDVTPWPWLSFSGSYDSAQTNLFQEAGRSLSETESRSLGLRLYRNPWPTVYGRYYESNLSTRTDFPVEVRARTKGLYTEAIKRFGFLEPYLRYERFDYHDELNAANSYLKNSPQVGLRGYHQNITWYVQAQYDKYSPASAGQGFIGPYFKVGGSYYYSPNLFVSAELTYRTETKRYGGQASINWKLPYNFQLQAFGYYEKGNNGAGDFVNNFSTNQLSLRLTKTISWGEKSKVAGLKPGQEWLGSGTIEGWVFNDTNLNANKDSDEPGVTGIKVKLEDGSEVATDQQGYYQFAAVGSGKHVVTLDARRIPAAFTFTGSETVAVEVQRRTKARVDFPFAKGSSIKGRVMEDHKGTGEPAPGAKGLADVLVLLQPGNLNTYTDSEGYYAFEGILPKSYEITVDRETLPEYSEISAPRLPLKIDLTAGEQKKDLLILIHPQERRVIFK